jgi:hypothetical protein
MEHLKAIIGVPPDKDDYVIEVYSDTASFAEIERQGEGLSMKIYNHSKSDHWHIDMNQMYEILKKAKAELG